MNYYIHNGTIHETEAELEYERLTDDQIARYLDGNENTIGYVLNGVASDACGLSCEQLQEMIYKNYEFVETKNLTPAGAVQLKEWCDAGIPYAIENFL